MGLGKERGRGRKGGEKRSGEEKQGRAETAAKNLLGQGEQRKAIRGRFKYQFYQ